LIAFTAFATVFIVLTAAFVNMTSTTNENISDMISGFQVGVFIGFQLTMLIYISKYTKALKTEDELKKLYIKEHDERTKLIKDKIGGTGFNFSLVAITTAAIMAGFFNELIFFTLLGVLSFMSLLKGFLKLYYRNKF